MKVLSKYFIYGFQVIALVSIVCSYALEFLRKFSNTGKSRSAAERVSTCALCRSLVKYSYRGSYCWGRRGCSTRLVSGALGRFSIYGLLPVYLEIRLVSRKVTNCANFVGNMAAWEEG